MTPKDELRQRVRDLRAGLSAEERASRGARAVDHLLTLAPVRAATRVALYAALESAGELSVDAAFALLRERGAELFFPRAARAGAPLAFAAVADLSTLRPARFGVREPGGPEVPLASIDVVVVPGMAFDVTGCRLGWGAGYYDRTLASYGGTSVGIGYGVQLVAQVPAEAHDVRVHYVVSEDGVVGGSLWRNPP